MEHKSFVGVLTFVPYGPDGAKHYFELESGEFLNVKFEDGLDFSEVPLNRKIALCMSEKPIVGYHIVCSHDKFFTLLSDPRRVMAASAGLIKKHIGIFRQVPLDTTDEDLGHAENLAKGWAQSVQTFYRRYARHVWDVQVRGYAMRGEQSYYPPTYASTDIKNFMAEHDMEGFVPNYFHVVSTSGAKGMCGQGNLPGNRSVTYGLGCGTDTMCHELGHNFGLHHASTYEAGADPETVEYGDRSSVMGAGNGRGGFNSVDLVRLGLEDEREILEVTDTRQVIISPIELPPHGMHDVEHQDIRIIKNKFPVHLSLRKKRGSFYSFSGSAEETLFVHEYASDLHSIRHLKDLLPGQSKNLSNGTRVEYLEYANEMARVNIYYNPSDPKPEDIPMPVGFPPGPPSVSVGPEHTGAWYNPDFNGEGFDIQVRQNKLVLYWYTYNHKQKQRRFYHANVPLKDGPIEFDIMTTDLGTWTDPTKYQIAKAGTGQLYFLDGANGIFNFNLDELGRGSIEIVPVALSTGNASDGIYYQPSRNGEGFTIEFFDQLNSCVAFWYSYGPKDGTRPNSRQRWYICQGDKNDDGTYDLTVRETPDNMWMGLREDPGAVDVGNAKVMIIDGDHITFDYDIATETVVGSGTFNLERLF
jgi:hypothetical protein